MGKETECLCYHCFQALRSLGSLKSTYLIFSQLLRVLKDYLFQPIKIHKTRFVLTSNDLKYSLHICALELAAVPTKRVVL